MPGVILPVARTRKARGGIRLVPVNAILGLALADGLNPAPLAAAGWAVAALEMPVRVSGETVVCDVVLFNPQAGHLLAVEAKSGANLEPEQGRRLTALTPELLVSAGGITVPKPVPCAAGSCTPALRHFPIYAAQPRAVSCAPSGTPRAGQPRRSQSASAT